MAILTMTVVIVAPLSAVNLLLMFGVLRRLREHTEMLNGLSGAATIGVGQEVSEFTAAAIDGTPLSRDSLADNTLIGFFTPTCQACVEMLPKYLAYARAHGMDRSLAVVVGGQARVAAQVAQLRRVALVAVDESDAGPICQAFEVKAFPAVLMVGRDAGGRVVVTEQRVQLDRLPVSA